MRYPLKMTANLARYIAKKRFNREEKFPMVLMLEPLHACNLTCTGCGRIREYKSTINESLTVEECLKAVDDCGSPVVSICGGEPMIYPEIGRLTKEILDRGRHIILCTNGMFIRKRLHEFKPTSSFFWNVHLDGMERTHDLCVEKRRRVPRCDRRHQGRQGGRFSGLLEYDDLQGDRPREIAELFAYLDAAGRGWLHAFPGLFVRGRAHEGYLHVARRRPATNSAPRSSFWANTI